MKIKKGFVVREVGGKKYAVATGEVAKSFKGMLGLNDMGALIFDLLQKDTTRDEVVDAILKDYDVDRQTVEVDVDKFISQLKSIDVVED
ncbi:MAG: PqqD family protein [Clostridia bacterium]|nr:PqqD family protein [Clostridia bacterium]